MSSDIEENSTKGNSTPNDDENDKIDKQSSANGNNSTHNPENQNDNENDKKKQNTNTNSSIGNSSINESVNGNNKSFNGNSKTIKYKFINAIEKEDISEVDNFVDELLPDFNKISWADKYNFLRDDIKEYFDPKKPLEDMDEKVQGFFYLCQLCINLLKDPVVFKKHHIRTYSNGYHYMTKIKFGKKLLKNIGYDREGNVFILKEYYDRKTKEWALETLIAYMELKELLKLKTKDTITMEDLISKRKEHTKSEDEILEQLKECPYCDTKIDIKYDKTCSGCEEEIVTFPIVRRHASFIKRKFNIDVEPWVELPENKDEPSKDHSEPSKDHWNCKQCTFLNPNSSSRCDVCEALKQ